MTPISIAYFILGLVALFWPLTTIFFKREVLGAQWLMMTALILFGLSVILYSTFFNTFLKGEYVLVILYMLLSLSVPPMTQMAVTSLTRRQGVSRMARTLVVPSLVVGVFMAVSVIIGGADMYRLWIERGADASAHVFYPGSWRYNLIVAVHYYFYWFVLVGETFFAAIYAAMAVRRFRHELDEYYTADTTSLPTSRLFYVAVGLNCLAVIVSYVVFPFNRPRPLWAVLVFCIVQSVAVYLMGSICYRITYGAESLRPKMRRRTAGHAETADIARKMVQYIEKEEHYLEPDISVFLLADRFRCSQDEVVDAIHQMHGTTFSGYIDSLRIEHALLLQTAEADFDPADQEQMTRLAHRCGYLNVEDFERAFERIMHTSIDKWNRG